MFRHIFARSASLGITLVLWSGASAFGGMYKTIGIDGNFDDWNDVPVLYSGTSGTGSPIDLAHVQIANDDNDLYIRITYHTAVNPNASPSVYLSFDTDNDTTTGYDIYGLHAVGAEASFVNDFGFDQRTGWNVGDLSASAGISPYSTVTTSQEYRITRALTYASDSAPVFDNDSFTLLVWTDGDPADATAAIPYSFAVVPEPTSLSVLALGAIALMRRRR